MTWVIFFIYHSILLFITKNFRFKKYTIIIIHTEYFFSSQNFEFSEQKTEQKILIRIFLFYFI